MKTRTASRLGGFGLLLFFAFFQASPTWAAIVDPGQTFREAEIQASLAMRLNEWSKTEERRAEEEGNRARLAEVRGIIRRRSDPAVRKKFVEQIREAFTAKEVGLDYAKACTLLAEDGVAAALDFLTHQHDRREASIAELRQAEKRPETDWHRLLREELLEGLLLEIDFQPEKAQAIYFRACLDDSFWGVPRRWAEDFRSRQAKPAANEAPDGQARLELLRAELQVATEAGDSERQARLTQEIETLLADLKVSIPSGELLVNIKRAIETHRAEMEALFYEEVGDAKWRAQAQWARSLVALATLSEQPASLRLYEEAREIFRAMEIQTRAALPKIRAAIEQEIADSAIRIATRVDDKGAERLLADARAGYHEALAAEPREQNEAAWAQRQNALAQLLGTSVRRGPSTEAVQRAEEQETAARAALEVYTPEKNPKEWGEAEQCLAHSLFARGEITMMIPEKRAFLSAAAEVHRALLKSYSPEKQALIWADLATDLAITLLDLAKQEPATERRQLQNEAIQSYRAARKILTRAGSPEKWARLEYNLGLALAAQARDAERHEQARYFREAIACHREALEVLTREHFTKDWVHAELSLAKVLREDGEATGGNEGLTMLKEALEILKAVLASSLVDDSSPYRSAIYEEIGDTHLATAKLTGGEKGTHHCAEAMEAFRTGLKKARATEPSVRELRIRLQLVEAILERGEHLPANTDALIEEAVYHLSQARQTISDPTAQFDPRIWHDYATTLRRVSSYIPPTQAAPMLAGSVQVEQKIFKVFSFAEHAEDWARAQSGLSRALIEQIRHGSPQAGELADRAVNAARSALEIADETYAADEWAAAEFALGSALEEQAKHLTGPERARARTESGAAFRAALGIWTPERGLRRWVELRDEVAAFLTQAAESDEGEKAAELWTEALRWGRETADRPGLREDWPDEWAAAQESVAYTLRRQAGQKSGEARLDLLDAACETYRTALTALPVRDWISRWLQLQTELAGCLTERAKDTPDGPHFINQALEVYQATDRELARAHHAHEAAVIRMKASELVEALKPHTDAAGRERLSVEAINLLRSATEIFGKESDWADWAQAQSHLGLALYIASQTAAGEKQFGLLAQSQEASENALKVLTATEQPNDWARSQFTLGDALAVRGKSEGGAGGRERLERALKAFRDSLEVTTERQAPEQWKVAQAHIVFAEEALTALAEEAEDD